MRADKPYADIPTYRHIQCIPHVPRSPWTTAPATPGVTPPPPLAPPLCYILVLMCVPLESRTATGKADLRKRDVAVHEPLLGTPPLWGPTTNGGRAYDRIWLTKNNMGSLASGRRVFERGRVADLVSACACGRLGLWGVGCGQLGGEGASSAPRGEDEAWVPGDISYITPPPNGVDR